MKKNFKNVLLYIGIPIVFIITMLAVSYFTKNNTEMKYSEIVQMIKDNEVSEFTLNLYSGELNYTKRDDGKSYRYNVADASVFYNDINDAVWKIKEENKGTDKDIDFHYDKGGQGAWVLSLLPTLFMVGLLVVFWIFMMKRMNATMGADKTMGFSIVVNDADNKERKGWIEYNSGVGRDKNSKLFGTLKFAS